MARLLKIIAALFSAVILIIIIAAVALPLIIDPNDFKPEIQAAVKENLGRDLEIEGNIELSVFPWIGVSTGKLILSNAQGFSDKPFAQIAESQIKVKLIPLFSKQIEVNTLVFKGVILNLAKNKKGISNWSDLTRKKEADEKTANNDTHLEENQETNAASAAIPLAALVIGGVSIEQAKVVWDDQQKGQYIEINDFNFTTGKLVFNEDIDLDLSLSIFNKQNNLTEILSLSTKLVINENLDHFQFQSLSIDSTTKDEDIPGKQITLSLLANVDLNWAQQTIGIEELNIKLDDMLLIADFNGEKIIDKPVFKGLVKVAEFNLVQVMESIAMPLPEMQADDALNKVSASFNLHLTNKRVDIQNLTILLDQSNITGTTSINNFSEPEIAFNINIDSIDVDRYLSAEKSSASKTTTQNKIAIASPASAAVASAELFPVDSLRALNASGLLSISKLKVNNMTMHGVNLRLDAKKGIIKTQQNIKQIYQGAYTGNTVINVVNSVPALALNEKIINMQLKPMLNDLSGSAKMTGLINATVKIQGYGNSETALRSSLKGKVDFKFKDGVIKGFNLQKIIDSGKALLKGEALPTNNKNDQTVFSIMKGTVNITNGIATNDDLYAEASKLRVNGKGSASLVTKKLDYKVNAKLLKRVATETKPEKINGTPLVFDIGGTFSKPSYKLDIAAMLTEEHKEKIDKVLNKLDKKLGPGIGNLIRGLF